MKNFRENLGLDESFLFPLDGKIREDMMSNHLKVLQTIFHPDVSQEAKYYFPSIQESLENLNKKIMALLDEGVSLEGYSFLELEKEIYRLEKLRNDIKEIQRETELQEQKLDAVFYPPVFKEKKEETYSLYDVSYVLGLSYEFVQDLEKEGNLLLFLSRSKKKYLSLFEGNNTRIRLFYDIEKSIQENTLVTPPQESYENFLARKKEEMTQNRTEIRRETMKSLLLLYKNQTKYFLPSEKSIKILQWDPYDFTYVSSENTSHFLSFCLPFSFKDYEKLSFIEKEILLDVLSLRYTKEGQLYKNTPSALSLKNIEKILQFVSLSFQPNSLLFSLEKNAEGSRYAKVLGSQIEADISDSKDPYMDESFIFKEKYYKKLLRYLSDDVLKKYIKENEIYTENDLESALYHDISCKDNRLYILLNEEQKQMCTVLSSLFSSAVKEVSKDASEAVSVFIKKIKSMPEYKNIHTLFSSGMLCEKESSSLQALFSLLQKNFPNQYDVLKKSFFYDKLENDTEIAFVLEDVSENSSFEDILASFEKKAEILQLKKPEKTLFEIFLFFQNMENDLSISREKTEEFLEKLKYMPENIDDDILPYVLCGKSKQTIDEYVKEIKHIIKSLPSSFLRETGKKLFTSLVSVKNKKKSFKKEYMIFYEDSHQKFEKNEKKHTQEFNTFVETELKKGIPFLEILSTIKNTLLHTFDDEKKFFWKHFSEYLLQEYETTVFSLENIKKNIGKKEVLYFYECQKEKSDYYEFLL